MTRILNTDVIFAQNDDNVEHRIVLKEGESVKILSSFIDDDYNSGVRVICEFKDGTRCALDAGLLTQPI